MARSKHSRRGLAVFDSARRVPADDRLGPFHRQRAEAARQRSEAAYQLVLEGARQGVPVYGFNRGSGARREEVIFEGDPLSDENRDTLLAIQHVAMFPSMLVAMLLRREEYSHAAHGRRQA